jgi:hypothetical protein
MKYQYTEPTQKHNGMWKSKVLDGDKIVLIVEKTTKKGLQLWIKQHKKEN